MVVFRPAVPLADLFGPSSVARATVQAKTATVQAKKTKAVQAKRKAVQAKSKTRPSGARPSGSAPKFPCKASKKASRLSASAGAAAGVGEHPHRRVHPSFKTGCAVCQYLKLRKGWERTGVSSTTIGQGTRLVWLREKPARWGGRPAWALGCLVCHNLCKKLEEGIGGVGSRGRRCSTKWARFEVQGFASMQASALQLHSRSAVHKMAVQVWLRPDDVELVLRATLGIFHFLPLNVLLIIIIIIIII